MYNIYDIDGCAYECTISKEKISYADTLVGTADSLAAAYTIAARYLFDCQQAIDYAYDREYYVEHGYPKFNEKEYYSAINVVE